MRKYYSLLLYLVTPLALLYLALRGLRDRNYLKRWPERFAFFDAPKAAGAIVVHAASMGEVNAVSALARELGALFPAFPLCLTTVTPTGSGRVRTLFADGVCHLYAPLDLPGAVRRFFDRVQPRLLLITETEIWPNLYHEAYSRGIPVIIVNARISEHSIATYRRFRGLTADALGKVSLIAAQSERDAARLIEIGADKARVTVTGNLKFDVNLPPGLLESGGALRLAWGTERLVLTAGSTHEGDEGPLFEAFKGVLETFPTALLVLVPRHPERFRRAAQLARTAGLRVSVRSESPDCPLQTQCFIIDSMGALLSYYAACDVAFVGGSLAATGGQNVLEPAALGRPVVVGPHTFNFSDITQQLIKTRGALRIQDAQELEQAVCRLFHEPELRDRMGHAGLELIKSGQGALQHTLELVKGLLDTTSTSH
jgi:3-deoxy-D-manno-octulosonic-acid transferase